MPAHLVYVPYSEALFVQSFTSVSTFAPPPHTRIAMPATLWVQGFAAVPNEPSATRPWSVAPNPAFPTIEQPHSPPVKALHVILLTVRFRIVPPFTWLKMPP